MKITTFILFLLLSTTCMSQEHDTNKTLIPLGGNAWTINGGEITKGGLEDWDNAQTSCKTYFKITQTGKLKLSLLLNAHSSKSKISVTILNKSILLEIDGNTEKEYFVGEWDILKTGYLSVNIKGISKISSNFGSISNLVVSGSAVTPDMAYTKNDEGNFY